MSVRLYGRAVGHGSLSVVTAGFREALESAGLLEGFVALDKSGGDEEQDAPPGALARDGVFTGNLGHVPMMRRGSRHERHWVQVTPNSTHVPRQLLAAILDLPNPQILSASAWGTRVIVDNLLSMGLLAVHSSRVKHWQIRKDGIGPGEVLVDIHTMGHGVSGFAPVPEEIERTRVGFERGEFRVIHFSTTDGERKGTLELVQAWTMFLKCGAPKAAELLLVLDHHANVALQERLRGIALDLPPGVRVLPRGDMDATTMSNVLCHMHLMAAPSRGEGFHLGVLEARACGVPVVCTDTTGLSAGHATGPGIVVIPQLGTMEPIDDGPAALAPPVFPFDIANALMSAQAYWCSLSEIAERDAPTVARDWSWQNQLAPLVELLR